MRVPSFGKPSRATVVLTALFGGLLGLLSQLPVLAQLPQSAPPKRAPPAAPEESARDASILRRPNANKPEGLAIGGGFLFLPKVEIEGEFDDNVFRTRNNRKSDFISKLRPGFAVNSDWGEHSLGFAASAEIARYANLTRENYEAFTLAANGKYEINEELSWANEADFARTALPRGSPGLFGSFSNKRQIAHVASAASQLVYVGDPFFGRFGPRFRRVKYVQGVTFDEDVNVYEIGGRAGYKVTPDLSVFVDPSYQWVRFDRRRDVNGLRRNNQGFDVRVGAAYDLGRDVTAEAGVGYFRRMFEGAGKASDGLSFLGRVFWNPTDTLSFEAEARRAFTQYRVATGTAAALANAVETYIGGRVGWEPIEPVLVDAGASFARYTFNSSGIKENYVLFDAGARYFVNPHMYAGPRYHFERRFASPSALSYTDNRFLITLGAQW